MKKSLTAMILPVVLVLLFVAACQPEPLPAQPTPALHPAPTLAPTLAPEAMRLVEWMSQAPDAAPRVVETDPPAGGSLALASGLTLTFDQPMDTDATAKALELTDAAQKAVTGSVTWKNSREMVFQPQQPLQAGATYQARLDVSARSARGKAIEQPLKLSFQVSGALQVSQVFPADQSKDVEALPAITVMFNRPVVPLVIAEDQAKLVQPLTIEPAVSGQGEWVNTSLYVFHPEKPLLGGRTYQVKVSAGLADSTGEKGAALEKDYTWSFTAVAPSIGLVTCNDVAMGDATQGVTLTPTFRVQFPQPMDRASVEANLQLKSSKGGVALQYKWNEKNTQVEVKPAQPLSLKTDYTFSVDAAARTPDGSPLSKGISRALTTVPYPAIERTTPKDGATNANPTFDIQFASPMDFKSLADKVVFTPAVDTKTHSFFNSSRNMLSFYGLAASTRYTVRILPGMRDPYGNEIQSEMVVKFTTAPLSPYATLMVPYQPVIRADGPQDVYLQYTNLDSVRLDLYRLTLDQIGSILNYDSKNPYRGVEADRVWQFSEKPTGKTDEKVLKDLVLTGSDGKPLSPGFYFLGLNASPVKYSAPFFDTRLMFVATDAVTLKISPGQLVAWVTGLTSGKPSAGVKVKVLDRSLKTVAEGTTDAYGLFKAEINTTTQSSNTYADNFQRSWYLLVDDTGHFGFGSSLWGSGVTSSPYGAYDLYYSAWRATTAYVYTERPLYRPGQPVYFKGIVRNDDDLAYTLPSQKQVEVVISSYKEQVYKETLPLSEIGTFDGEFKLATEAALGSYILQVRLPGSQSSLNSINFDVAEYRRPEFQLDVKSDPVNVLIGDEFKVGIEATYYSGGGLSNADVEWTLRSAPYSFTAPAAYSRYSFSDLAYDNWYSSNGNQSESRTYQVAEGSGKTDGNGKIQVPLKAQSPSTQGSRRLMFEATITDFSGSSVSGQIEAVMHKGQVYPGIRSKSYVANVNQDQTFELVALDWAGKPQGGAKVDVEIVERKWYSVQKEDDNGQLTWTTSVQETPVTKFEGVQLDEKGLGSVSFKPAKGGIYRARVTARDARGNLNQASAFLWVAGKEYVPWIQSNDRTFQLIADRDSYDPGETAELLIASPFQGENYALVTVERGHVRSSEVVKLTGNSAIYRLPVTPDMAPNVYVEVQIVKGVDETSPRPNFKVGMARLQVSTTNQSLKVTLTADPAQAAPRQPVKYTVQTTTQDGKPVQAEVSLALSDLATLSLRNSSIPPLLNFFYASRSLSVTTGVSIVQSIEDYNAKVSDLLKAQGAKAGSGGGKGGGAEGVVEVRQDFPDTAFWQADVRTGVDGKATVTVTLPDNLTTWRMDARAVTADTRVGQTTLDLISTRPLFIRPQTPRFLVDGDRVTLGAAVHNNTDQSLKVDVRLDAGGVTLESPAAQTVEIAAKGQAYVTWTASVPAGSQRVDLTFSAEGGGYKDATKPTLATLDGQGIPVYRYEVPETVGTSGVLSDNGARAETISLPAGMQIQQGQLNVELSTSLAAGMTDGLTYLEHYPYECTEQTISRFLPNVRLTQALRAAGIQDAALEANLKTQVNVALQKLYSRQNPSDGGWGWWTGMDSDALTSAYVVLGLYEARTAGYEVNAQSIQRGQAYLKANLQSFGENPAPEQLNRQAFLLYVLGRSGSPEVSKTVQLYDYRQSMALYARAYLLQTLHKINAQDERLKTLVSDLANAAILSAAGTHWEEARPDYWNWNTDLRSTAIVLAALIETDPKNGLNPNAVRWLMSNRKAGHWASTQETAWTLLALTDWAAMTDDLKPDYRYGAAFNGKDLVQDIATQANVRAVKNLKVDVTQMLAEEANRLVFARDGSAGNLYYTAYLNLWLPVNQVKALDRGLILSRQYFRPDDLAHPVTSANQGDVLLARLTVVAPNTLRYLVVDDPLPAGMEAVDASLNTSPKALQPEGYSWKRIGTDGWGWWFFSHIEKRDEKVVLSTNVLSPGTYVYTYLVRASTPGTFNVIPPTAQEFYFPDVYGRGDGSQFEIKP